MEHKDYKTLEKRIKQFHVMDEATYDCLFQICEKNEIDTNVLKTFLKNAKLDLNKRNSHGESILHILSRNGHFIWVQYLIKKHSKVKIDAKCDKRKTPLLLAAEYGYLDIAKLLERHGADINQCDSVQDSALHLAAAKGHLDCIKYLVEEKVNKVDLKNKYEDTPLIKAAYYGHEHCVKYLLERGANITNLDFDGQSALFKAAYNGHLEILKILLHVPDGVNRDSKFRTDYIDMACKKGKTALILAAGFNHLEVVTYLINLKADIDKKDNTGATALIWAASLGHVEVVNYLIKAKAKVDIQNEYGGTALSWAAGRGHLNCVEALIKAKANIDLADNPGETALMKAARYDCVEVFNFLIKSGANVDLKNKNNKTAFDLVKTRTE